MPPANSEIAQKPPKRHKRHSSSRHKKRKKRMIRLLLAIGIIACSAVLIHWLLNSVDVNNVHEQPIVVPEATSE